MRQRQRLDCAETCALVEGAVRAAQCPAAARPQFLKTREEATMRSFGSSALGVIATLSLLGACSASKETSTDVPLGDDGGSKSDSNGFDPDVSRVGDDGGGG